MSENISYHPYSILSVYTVYCSQYNIIYEAHLNKAMSGIV